jgi:Tfp pilus assembly protein FimT
MEPTVSRVVKDMMRTYTAPTPTEKTLHGSSTLRNHVPAFVLAEMLMVLVIVSLFFSLAMLNIFGIFGKSSFKAKAQELVDVMRMAVTSAAETDKRYEIIFDVAEQTYTLRQITSSDLSEVLEDDIIQTGNFTENFQLSYIQFDDSWRTNEDFEMAYFRAGRSGWQAGGKIVLLDSSGKEYSILVNRLNRTIELREGDAELLISRENVPF